jgi:hypothetical protein
MLVMFEAFPSKNIAMWNGWIVSTTKGNTMNHPTKIKVNKHNERCRATFNNLDNILTWMFPFHATWTYGFDFKHKKKITSKLLFAPQKIYYVALCHNSNKPCHFHFTTNERENPITTFFNWKPTLAFECLWIYRL